MWAETVPCTHQVAWDVQFVGIRLTTTTLLPYIQAVRIDKETALGLARAEMDKALEEAHTAHATQMEDALRAAHAHHMALVQTFEAAKGAATDVLLGANDGKSAELLAARAQSKADWEVLNMLTRDTDTPGSWQAFLQGACVCYET